MSTILPGIAEAVSESLEASTGKRISEALATGFNAMNQSVRGFIPQLITSADVTRALGRSVSEGSAAAVQSAFTESFKTVLVSHPVCFPEMSRRAVPFTERLFFSFFVPADSGV